MVVFLAHVVAVAQFPEGVIADRLRWGAIELRRGVEVVLPDGLSGWKHRLAAQLAGSALLRAGWDGSAWRLGDPAWGGDGRGVRRAGWDGSAVRLDDRAWGGDDRGARPVGRDDPAWRLDDRVWGGDDRGARPVGRDDPAWWRDDRVWGEDGQGERPDDPAWRKDDRAGCPDDQVAFLGDRVLRRGVQVEHPRACRSPADGPQEDAAANWAGDAILVELPKPDSSTCCSSPSDCSRPNRPTRRCRTRVRLERRFERRALNHRPGRKSARGWLGRCR